MVFGKMCPYLGHYFNGFTRDDEMKKDLVSIVDVSRLRRTARLSRRIIEEKEDPSLVKKFDTKLMAVAFSKFGEPRPKF